MKYLLPTVITHSSACTAQPRLSMADTHCGNGFFGTEADVNYANYCIDNDQEEKEIST
jgi:hypothetical protein